MCVCVHMCVCVVAPRVPRTGTPPCGGSIVVPFLPNCPFPATLHLRHQENFSADPTVFASSFTGGNVRLLDTGIKCIHVFLNTDVRTEGRWVTPGSLPWGAGASAPESVCRPRSVHLPEPIWNRRRGSQHWHHTPNHRQGRPGEHTQCTWVTGDEGRGAAWTRFLSTKHPPGRSSLLRLSGRDRDRLLSPQQEIRFLIGAYDIFLI